MSGHDFARRKLLPADLADELHGGEKADIVFGRGCQQSTGRCPAGQPARLAPRELLVSHRQQNTRVRGSLQESPTTRHHYRAATKGSGFSGVAFMASGLTSFFFGVYL